MARLPGPFEPRPTPTPARSIATIRDPGRVAIARADAAGEEASIAISGVRAEGAAQQDMLGARAELGRAMSTAGSALFDVGRQMQERRDRQEYIEAQHKLLSAQVRAEQEISADNDYRTYEARFEERIKTTRDELAQGIGNNVYRAEFMSASDLDLVQGKVRISERALARERDFENGARADRQVQAHEDLIAAGDGPAVEKILEVVSMDIDAAVASGYITAERAQQEKQGFVQSYAGTRLEAMTDEQRVDVLTKANAGAKGWAAFLPVGDRIRELNAASERVERVRVATEEHAYRMAERAEKERQEQAAAEGDELLRNGKLTPEWIEQNAGRMSASDRRFFYREMTEGGGASTDVDLYADLRSRAGSGEDVRDEARVALQQGRLKLTDYDKIVTAAESNTVAGTGWHKRGEEYLTRFLKPSELNKTGLEAQTFANALDDWQQWARKNPDATDEQAEAAYRRIAGNYATVKANEIRLVRPAPLYLVGGRDAPEIDATETATVEAMERGEISRAEFERQAALIQEWRDMLDRERAAAAAAGQ